LCSIHETALSDGNCSESGDNVYAWVVISSAEEGRAMPVDPVCKMEVDQETAPGHTEYDGKEFYFCSLACQQKFEHDPGAYIDLQAA
jgi:YHS domain-containing protein